MSNSRNFDVSVESIEIRQFPAQCFEDLHSRNAKMKNIRRPKKSYIQKFIALTKAKISQQDINTTSKILLVNHDDLGLLVGTSKRNLHKFGHRSANNFQNMNLKWSISPFENHLCQFWGLTRSMCRLERSSDVFFTNITHFESSNFLHETFFEDTWYIAHTLIFKALLCETLIPECGCSFFKSIFESFALFRAHK